MKKWFVIPAIFVLIFITALFLTPDFTRHCTAGLFDCMNQARSLGFWLRLWGHLGCVFHNVICVLGGLFI